MEITISNYESEKHRLKSFIKTLAKEKEISVKDVCKTILKSYDKK